MNKNEEKSLSYLKYAKNGNSIVILGYRGEPERLWIPSRIEGLPVTAIGKKAFEDCASLMSLTLPESLASIGKNAFLDCVSLTSMAIPRGVCEIGANPWIGCDQLISLTTAPNHSYFISKDGALLSKDGRRFIAYLKSQMNPAYQIPDGVAVIGEGAFEDCGSLVSLIFPESVTVIGKNAFRDCRLLKSAVLPNGVTSIERGTFAGCQSLTSLTLPESLTSVGELAFSHCRSLTSLTLPGRVTQIGRNAFLMCLRLMALTLPQSVTEINQDAFSCYSGGLTIYGPSDSEAQRFAKENNIEFISL